MYKRRNHCYALLMHKLDLKAPSSLADVIHELEELNTRLDHNELKQFLLFNKAYTIVTTAIQKSEQNGYFNNPEFIEKFSICFSSYYFKAINMTLDTDPELPFAWGILNKSKLYKATPNFILLLMGANAHISHDLPLALNELMGKEKTDDLLQDVKKIDKILMKSGREIISIFDEPNRVLDFLKRNFTFLYYRPAMYTILYWRVKAWHNYREIKEHGLEASNYQKSSIKIAKRLALIARLLS